MRYLSLFSGIGGFELGIQQAYDDISDAERKKQGRNKKNSSNIKLKQVGAQQSAPRCIGYSEIDKYATKIYEKHFQTHTALGDITKIDARDLPDFDLICGGFPCQSFSIAGKRRGFEDTRGTLFFEIARIAREKQPRLLLLENVKGLLSHDQGRTFFTIISSLDELGYDTQWQVLNSKDFGVPQNRERVFIVGHLRGTPRPQVFPIIQNDEVPHGSDESKQGRSQAEVSHTLRGPNIKADQVFIAHENRSKNVSKRETSAALRSGASHNYQTVNAIRRLTPIECERLQGFPDGWTEGLSDTQRYKTLGNAVTVNVIRAICRKIFLSL